MSEKRTDRTPDQPHSGFEDTMVPRLAIALVCAVVMVAALLVILSNVFHVV